MNRLAHKNNVFFVILAVVAMSLFAVFSQAATSETVSCIKDNIHRNVPSINVNGNLATSQIVNNNTGDCRITLVSYSIWSDRGGAAPHYIDQQTIFRSTSVTVGPGQTANLSVALPNCYSQVDLVLGAPIEPPNYHSSNFLGVEFWDVGDPDGTQRYCNEVGTPTPSPTPSQLTCAPSFQTILGGQSAQFIAAGGNNSDYFWIGPNANPATGTGSVYNPTYPAISVDQTHTATVRSGGEFAICTIRVIASAPNNASVGISKTVRSFTTNGGEAEALYASPNDTVEFILRVNTFGSTPAANVRVSDTLPSGLRYIYGSTTVDNQNYTDGILGGGITIGDIAQNRTVTIRFRAAIDPETSFVFGTTALTNIAFVSASNASQVSDTAMVNVIRTNPVVIPGNISIQKYGRNITRGQVGEFTSVTIGANNTLEFTIRVRSLSASTLTNVIVSDAPPVGVTYIPNSTTVNDNTVSDAVVNTGINIGSLVPNQEAVLRLRAVVGPSSTFPNGSTSAFNIASARADNTPTVSSQLPLTYGGTIGIVASVQTGNGSSALMALLLSGILTYGYIYYTRTNVFLRRDANAAFRRFRKDNRRFNFARFL